MSPLGKNYTLSGSEHASTHSIALFVEACHASSPARRRSLGIIKVVNSLKRGRGVRAGAGGLSNGLMGRGERDPTFYPAAAAVVEGRVAKSE